MKEQDKKAEIGLAEAGKSLNAYALECKEKELQLLGLCKIKRAFILDAGCGPGTFGIMLAQNGNTVVGTDLSSKVVGVAKERADKEKVIFWPLAADLEKLPFNSNAFDLCFCGNVLHHFTDIELVIGELTRVLKPGGTFACVENNGSNPLVRWSRVAARGLRDVWPLLREKSTGNIVAHTHNDYITALRKHEFTDIKVSSRYHELQPHEKLAPGNYTLWSRLLWYALNEIYAWGIYLLTKILPQPHKGKILLITGVKGQSPIRREEKV